MNEYEKLLLISHDNNDTYGGWYLFTGHINCSIS